MDETYQTYVNRVVRLALPATYQTQLQNIQTSPKFEGGQAVPFPGYSVITPPRREDTANWAFYTHLEASQAQLLGQLDQELIVPVPPESFHLTVADLIWERTYQEMVKDNPDFEQQLQDCIRDSFGQYQQVINPKNPIQWQIVGLIVFPRALAVGLVPKDEYAYEQILQLRRAIYQNSALIALGIEQQYYFTAHITLGYFGEISRDLDRDRAATTLTVYNDQWIETDPKMLTIGQVQLRKFTDMTRYEREPTWASDRILSDLNHPILEQSFAIIDREIGQHNLNPWEYAIARRVIHSTADFEYAQILKFSPTAIESGISGLRRCLPIITDVGMVKQGIATLVSKTFNNSLIVAVEQALIAQKGKTRTETGLLKCFGQCPQGIYVIGNAPTALLALCQQLSAASIQPELIIGVPVGFVNVVESKQALARINVPQIRVEGRKGGSPVAAAIINALLLLAWEMRE